jgi:hypothetical protein
MLPNPLGDVGLCSHHALIERTVPCELKILFLAIVGIGDGTNGQDDFDHLSSIQNIAFPILRLTHPNVSNFKEKSLPGGALPTGYMPTAVVDHLIGSVARFLPHRNLLRAAPLRGATYQATGLDIERERAMF